MKKITLAIAALSMTFAGAASAADMAVKARPAPTPVAAIYNWTGFYIGAHGRRLPGARQRLITISVNGGACPLGVCTARRHRSGFIGGGQVGYNWQAANWVLRP